MMLGFPIHDLTLTRKMWAQSITSTKVLLSWPCFGSCSSMMTLVVEVYQCIMLIGWVFSLGSGHRGPLQSVFGGCGQIANPFQRPGRKSTRFWLFVGKIHPHIQKRLDMLHPPAQYPTLNGLPEVRSVCGFGIFFLQVFDVDTPFLD